MLTFCLQWCTHPLRILRSQINPTCSSMRWTSTTVEPWCWTHSSKSRMRLIPPSPSDAHVEKVSLPSVPSHTHTFLQVVAVHSHDGIDDAIDDASVILEHYAYPTSCTHLFHLHTPPSSLTCTYLPPFSPAHTSLFSLAHASLFSPAHTSLLSPAHTSLLCHLHTPPSSLTCTHLTRNLWVLLNEHSGEEHTSMHSVSPSVQPSYSWHVV